MWRTSTPHRSKNLTSTRQIFAPTETEFATGRVIVRHNTLCPVRRNGTPIDVIEELSRAGFELSLDQTFTEEPTTFGDIALKKKTELSLPPSLLLVRNPFYTILVGIGKTYSPTHVEQAVSGGVSWLHRGAKTWFFWYPGSNIAEPCDQIVVQVVGTTIFVPGGVWHTVCSWGNTVLVGAVITSSHKEQIATLIKTFPAGFLNPATRADALSDANHVTGTAKTSMCGVVSDLLLASSVISENVVEPQDGSSCCDQEHLQMKAPSLFTDKAYLQKEGQHEDARRVATNAGALAYSRAAVVLDKSDPCKFAEETVKSYMVTMLAALKEHPAAQKETAKSQPQKETAESQPTWRNLTHELE
jgi:hypothetical protein